MKALSDPSWWALVRPKSTPSAGSAGAPGWAGDSIEAAIEAVLPPGWENTFVLHDVMVASGALTDMARLLFFASGEGLEARPRDALRDEALRIQAIADDIPRRWLASKYPMLGPEGIERLLAEPNREVLPLLGEYNVLAVDDLIRILRVPVLPGK